MGAIKKGSAKAKKSSGSSLGSKIKSGVGSLLSGGSKSGGGGKRRHHGVNYYANQVLKEKLKKKLRKIKYGGI